MTDKAKTVASALRLISGGDFATVGGEKVIRMAAELLDEYAVEIEQLRADMCSYIEVASEYKHDLAECRRLLREAVAYCDHTDDFELRPWREDARKAAGGE